MIKSTRKQSTRLLIVLQLIVFSIAANTPLLHAHEFGHGSDTPHSHQIFATHSHHDHVDDHDHEDNILDEEFDVANDFHTHNSETHTHFLEDILSITSINKRSRQDLILPLYDMPVLYEPADPIGIKDLHILTNPHPPPRYKDRFVVLLFTSLPPPEA